MTRRKQSNPKPSKREVEEHTFPVHQIYLRKFGTKSLVLAKHHLSAGTVLGTFKGILREETEEEQQDDKIVLKVSRCDGGSPVHVMLENEGRWLQLMRNAIVPTDANICLRISGGEILCTVTKDVNKEVELKVTCRIVDQLKSRICDSIESSSEGMINSEHSEEMSSNRTERTLRKSESEVRSDQEVPNHSTKHDEGTKPSSLEENNLKSRKLTDRKESFEENGIYKCPSCSFLVEDRRVFEKHVHSHQSSSFKRASTHMTNAQSFCGACNIQFMSVDTYQVHKKFYCKSRQDREDPRSSPSEPLTIPGAFKPSPDTVILGNGILNGAVATPSLIQPQAIYAAISTNPLILLPCSLVSGEGLVAQNGMAGTGMVLQTSPSSPAMVRKQSSASKKEDILPNRKTSHPAMSFNSRTPEVVSEDLPPLRKRKMSEGDVLNLKKTLRLSNSKEGVAESPHNDQDTPLDLSFKRRRTSDISFKRTSEADMECSRSPSRSPSRSAGFPGIIRSPSSSYSNDSIHCYSFHEPQLKQVSPSPPLLQAEDKSAVLPPGMPPPKVLKQGNNVCEECNIVFYKYDNYLAHKKHYCAYRRQQLSVLAAVAAAASSANCLEHSSDDNNSDSSAVHETAHGYSADENKIILRRLDSGVRVNKPVHSAFICDACGVKFSSLDTLNAHQTYYCSKRADSVMSKYVKSRSENSGSPSSVEPPFSGPEEWKCNYCETTSSSHETIRRHVLTHTEIRGFRCLLCGYKGNTLRGMRAHACEHLSESTTSIEEFMSSTIISENDALPVAELSDDDSESSKDHHKQIPRQERGCSETRDEAELSDCKETDSSDKTSPSEAHDNDSSRVKVEPRDSSPEESHSESVNPLALCDAVIKTEHTSSGDESRDGPVKTYIKSEPDSDCDSSSRSLSESPPVQPISVIRCGPEKDRREKTFRNALSVEANCDTQSKPTKLKYCKSCDISFYHMSNYVAHKKYYCTHPVPNHIQEATTVQ